MDKISVIVPVYNVENYLHQCIESIISQTYQQLEILLIDDGSTDSSGKICDDYALKDDRIRVIHKENGGVSSARNCGLKNATGECIAFVDADDWIEPEMYETMLRQLKENGVDIVKCLQKQDYSNEVICDALYEKEECVDMTVHKQNLLESIFIKGRMPSFSLMLIKKSLIDSSSIFFDESLKIGEDLLFVLKIYFNAKSIYFCNQFFYHYRIHDKSATNSKQNNKNMAFNLIELYRKIKNLFIENDLYQFPLREGMSNYFFYRLYMRCAKQVAMEKDNTMIDTLFETKEAKEMIEYTNRSQLSFWGKLFYDLIKTNRKRFLYLLCIVYGKLKMIS